jgi:putative ATP-binding cassette transporter
MPSVRGALWHRFLAITTPFFRSPQRGWAVGLLGLLLAFILCLNSLNVVGTYMCRNFMTGVAERQADQAITFALLWAGVFAALTVVAVFKAFTEERLRLWWRQWLTRHLFERYLAGRAYHHMAGRDDVDNPDQRITEDVRTFTEQALAIFLIIVNSTITLISFCGVLWSITPWLLLAAVAYTAFGSVTMVLLGKRLVKLDVRQFRKEADLRYDLIQVRHHAEQVALLGGEPEEGGRLRRRLAAVVENMRGIIGLSRNINFFATGFYNLSLLIPLVVTAPLYIRGDIEFGAIAQAQVAFPFVMEAFSLLVKEFQRISTFGAVIERLGLFNEVLDAESAGARKSPIEVAEDRTRVAFEGLTLVTPRDGRLLVKDLSLEVRRGRRLLILGPSGSGRTTLLRAAAGLWTAGQGRVVRPPAEAALFLPQRPYLRAGALREQFLYGLRAGGLTDGRIIAVLREMGGESVLQREGGLGAERDWANTLSLGEQQMVAFARLLLAAPPFAFLDEATSALNEGAARHLYGLLSRTPITYISVAGDPRLRDFHDVVLELGRDGLWAADSARPGSPAKVGAPSWPLPLPGGHDPDVAALRVEQGDERGVLEALRGVQRGDVAVLQVPQEGVEVGDREAEL